MGKKNQRRPNSPAVQISRKTGRFLTRARGRRSCDGGVSPTFKNSRLTDLASHIAFDEIQPGAVFSGAKRVNGRGIPMGLPDESSTGIAVVFGRDIAIYF